MGYLITLVLLLAAAFSFTLGGSMNDTIDKTKATIVDFIAPKSENETTVDILQKKYGTLDAFFSNTAPALLKQTGLSSQNKTALQSAVKAFQDSKPLVTKLEETAPQETSIVRMMLKKALGLESTPSPDPTSIPPQCRLECGQ